MLPLRFQYFLLVPNLQLSLPRQKESLPTSSLHDTTEIWAGGSAKSIPLTVALDTSLPIPSLKPFEPASFMFSRRRAPTDERMAGFPIEVFITRTGKLGGIKSYTIEYGLFTSLAIFLKDLSFSNKNIIFYLISSLSIIKYI